jgi:Mn-containing catalase
LRQDPNAAAALQELLGGKIHQLTSVLSAFTPDYAPEEMFEIATKLYKASR